jgi:hypothetical protein
MPHYRLPTLRGAFYFTPEVDADAEVDPTVGKKSVFGFAPSPKQTQTYFTG